MKAVIHIIVSQTLLLFFFSWPSHEEWWRKTFNCAFNKYEVLHLLQLLLANHRPYNAYCIQWM